MLLGQMDGRFSAPGRMTDSEHPRETDPYRVFTYALYCSALQKYFSQDLGLPPKDVVELHPHQHEGCIGMEIPSHIAGCPVQTRRCSH